MREEIKVVMAGEVDVIIIGAGISGKVKKTKRQLLFYDTNLMMKIFMPNITLPGLCAAKSLQDKYGLRVLVLEARDRVGGRTMTTKVTFLIIFCIGMCMLGG